MRMNSERIYAFARWLVVQLAGQAFKLVITVPLLAAIIGWAYAEITGLSKVWSTLIAVSGVAFVSVMLNMLWAFASHFSVKGALEIFGVQVELSRSRETGEPGYGIMVCFRSHVRFPLQLRVDRVTAHIEKRLALPNVPLGTAYDISPLGTNAFGVGLAELGGENGKTLHGMVDIDFSYGRKGRLNNHKRQIMRIWVDTNPLSREVIEARLYTEN